MYALKCAQNFFFFFWLCLALVVACRLQELWCMGLVAPRHVGFSSLTRDRAHVPFIGGQILNNWTTKEACTQFLKIKNSITFKKKTEKVGGWETKIKIFVEVLIYNIVIVSCVQHGCCCSVTQLCLTLWDPMDWGMPGFPVLHHLSRAWSNPCPLSQWCHPTISSSSPGSFNLSQHRVFSIHGNSVILQVTFHYRLL